MAVSDHSPRLQQDVRQGQGYLPTFRVHMKRSTLRGTLPEGESDDIPREDFPCVQQTVPFTDLPAEVRNRIYELVLPSTDAGDQVIIASPAVDDAMSIGVQPAITRATRQTRAESLSMFYANAPFYAYIEDSDFTPLVRWVQCATSSTVPKLPQIRVKVKLLNRLHCIRHLVALVKAWRQLKHETIIVLVSTCFLFGRGSLLQCQVIASTIEIAENRKIAGDTNDDIAVQEVREMVRQENTIGMPDLACTELENCKCARHIGRG